MKLKCENIVTCGNYACSLNEDGYCIHSVVALDSNGKCTLFKNKATAPAATKPAQEKIDLSKI